MNAINALRAVIRWPILAHEAARIAGFERANLIPLAASRDSRQANDSGETIEASIKAQYSLDAMDLHHGKMYCISRRQPSLTEHDLLGSLGRSSVHWEYLIDHTQQRIKRRLNRVPPLDGNVTVQNLLQHFSVGDETFPIAHQFF